MLIVVSPAKNLDFKTSVPSFAVSRATQAPLLSHTKKLVNRCKQLSPADLASLMKISDKLSILNAERYSSFEFPFNSDNARCALYAFNGDVYAGIDAQTLDQKAIEYAQSHLRILSGLYGVLKPLDLMQAYRLEMGIKLDIDEHKNLYQFWGSTITGEINKTLAQHDQKLLVNLASNEYFSSIKQSELDAKVITPVFKDEKNGKYKIISFYAKKARGMMARYIIENQIESLNGLKDFKVGGYTYDSEESNNEQLVFKRAENYNKQ